MMSPEAKRCTSCGETKPRKAFTRDASRADGLSSKCRECHNAPRRVASAGNISAHRAKRNAQNRLYTRRRRLRKTAATLAAWRPEPTPPMLPAPPRTVFDAGRAVLRARLAEEPWQAITRRLGIGWETVHRLPEMFVCRTLTASAATYIDAISLDPCSYCGSPGGERDHIVPRAVVGGETGRGTRAREWPNLTGACDACNRAKRDQTLLHFMLTPSP